MTRPLLIAVATAGTAAAIALAACGPPPSIPLPSGPLPSSPLPSSPLPLGAGCRHGAVTLDNVDVPSGVSCALDGTTVRGNIKVLPGGSLDANAVQVDGNVHADGAQTLSVRGGSRIGGNIDMKQGGGAAIHASTVAGNIKLDGNGLALVVAASTVDGNVDVAGNRAPIIITANHIDGNLKCKDNTVVPTGGGNVVLGNKQDQCAAI